MTLKVAVQMDPIESINIKGDCTFAMMLEAQARGHSAVLLPRPRRWRWAVAASSPPATTSRCATKPAIISRWAKSRRVDLASYDVVLMRQDPPFDMGYITATHLLEHIHPRTLVVNDPAEVRNAPEKLFVLRYPRADAGHADHPRPGRDRRLPRASMATSS